MVTTVTISLALAFDPAEPCVMTRPPRDSTEPLLSRYFLWRILFVSVMIGGLTLILSVLLQNAGYPPDKVRTVTLQTIVFAQAFHLFNSRSIRQSAFALDWLGNKAVFVVCGLMILLQLVVVYLPFMNAIFGTVPLGLVDWLAPMLLGIVVFFAVEGEKYCMRKLDARKTYAQ